MINKFNSCMFIAAAFFSGGCVASANIARIPASITQSYADGDYSKLDCPFGDLGNESTCRLTIGESGASVSYDLRPLHYGYRFVSQNYKVFGKLRSGNLIVRLEVGCKAEDIDLAKGDDDAECWLSYESNEGVFSPSAVIIKYENGGRFVEAVRDL